MNINLFMLISIQFLELFAAIVSMLRSQIVSGHNMTKALVTIEVDFDTYGIPVQTGLCEGSNPSHPGQRRIHTAKAEYIWDCVAELIEINPNLKKVVKVQLIKEEK